MSKTCLLLIWLAASATSNAQQSRIVPLNLYGGAFDIVEDYEGGVLVLTDAVLLRFDPDLRLLWHSQYEHFSHKHIRYDARNKLYIVSSQQTEVGGYRMLAFNLKGEQVWTAKRDVYNYPGATNDKIEDFLVDSANGRILIVGKTWYYQQRRQAYWSAVADMQGNILREDRRFYRKIEDNPISLSGLTKRTDGKGYFAFATDGFDTYGEQTKLVRYDSNFNYIDSLPLLPLDRHPETYERSRYECLNFGRLNDSEYLSKNYIRSNIGSDYYGFVFDLDFNFKYFFKKEENPDVFFQSLHYIKFGNYYLHNFTRQIRKTDKEFKTIWEREIKIPIHPKLPDEYLPLKVDPIEDSYVIPSRDGGFYGYAWHLRLSGILYIFKLDSLGRLYPNPPPERPELVVPVPNPARGQIRFDMPYHNPPLYPRHIRAVFYDMQGRPCLEVEGDKYTQHDISALRPGMYVVKTRIRENGEERTLKVMVE